VRFSQIIKETSHIKTDYFVPKTDWNVEIHGALALPDGSIVFNFERTGLAKLDRCGNIQWTLHRMTHHSVKQSDDGGFWVPGIRYFEKKDASPFPLLQTPYYEDTLLKVSGDGEVLAEISLPGLFFRNNLHGTILFANGLPGIDVEKSLPEKNDGEITHLNHVEELSATISAAFPEFAAGDLLVSERDFNLIMVIDPKTQQVKWHQRGPWIGQHDPHFESNGRISVLSNNNDGTETGTLLGGSSIMEIDPRKGSELDPNTGAITVKFGGTPSQKMYTEIRGKHQYLSNENILITETEAGRVFEINRKNEVVWEYINRYDKDSAAIVTQAIRYPESYFTVNDWTCHPSE